MDFDDFIIESNLIGISIGVIIGFGLTNWVKELRALAIVPIIDKFELQKHYGTFVSSTVELLILFFIIYLMYTYIVVPAVEQAFIKKENRKLKEDEWKEKLLETISSVNESIGSVDENNEDIKKNIKDLNANLLI